MNEYIYKPVSNEIEMAGAFHVRRKVFIEEQEIPEEEEYDTYDKDCLHVVAKSGENIIGTARVRFPASHIAKIERMAVLPLFRGNHVGKGIIFCIHDLLEDRPTKRAILHAQYVVIPFYQACGYSETGNPFWEAGIKHIKMYKNL